MDSLLTQVLPRGPRSGSEGGGEPHVEDTAFYNAMAAALDAPDPLVAEHLPDRYELLTLLGRGGMGEVYRVFDRHLHRAVALKVLSRHVVDDDALQRFEDEVCISAQLQHPGLVPIHDAGRLRDGRPFFTMREIVGQPLSLLIQEVHSVSTPGAWGVTPSGWSLRRLIDVLQRACEAVGYAHARGVLHRDLKPGNVLIGEFGETMVIDWGLALLRHHEAVRAPISLPVGHKERGDQQGEISGTPGYMAPEQAQGEVNRIGPATDVYALGGVLWQILTGQRPSQRTELGSSPDTGNSVTGPTGLAVPSELASIAQRALMVEPEDRFPDAAAFSETLRAWLEGLDRRERALALVARAEAQDQRAQALRARAASTRARLQRRSAALAPGATLEQKREIWDLEDAVADLETEARRVEITVREGLRAALHEQPDLPEAHRRLATVYMETQRAAEQRGDAVGAEEAEILLARHDREGRYAAYRKGLGALNLVTEPEGALARLHRVESIDRRLQPVFERELGRTPILRCALPMGSYVVTLHLDGHADVTYPVHIGRQEHWDGVPPGQTEPRPIPLPRLGQPGPDVQYVPAGLAWLGGDPEAMDAAPRRRVWVDGFAMQRFPVTNAAWLGFLNDCVQRGMGDEVISLVPRVAGQDQSPFRRSADGRFSLATGGMSSQVGAQPVVGVPARLADTFALWLGRIQKRAWRLPTEQEWEKAARGVDGRAFPFGDVLDPSFCNMIDSLASAPGVVQVGDFPLDESPYGVRGLGGNVRCWTQDLWRSGKGGPRPGEPERRVARGGFAAASARACRSAGRFSHPSDSGAPSVGLRLVLSWPL